MSEHQNILQIDTDVELQKIIRQLDSIPDQLKAPSVLASALNATANEMRRTMGKKARKRYAITDDRILKEKSGVVCSWSGPQGTHWRRVCFPRGPWWRLWPI